MYPSQVSPPRITGQNCICTPRALTCNYQFNPLKLIRNHMSENKVVAFITENKYCVSPRDMRMSMEFNQADSDDCSGRCSVDVTSDEDASSLVGGGDVWFRERWWCVNGRRVGGDVIGYHREEGVARGGEQHGAAMGAGGGMVASGGAWCNGSSRSGEEEHLAPRSKEGQFRNQDNTRKQGNNEETSKAMLAIDGVGFDWSDMAEEQVQTNMALMAFSDSE
ncbi:hypothetical protein Tco_1041767, partial [Tanacetum coccineum]